MPHQPFDKASQAVLRKAQELAKSRDGVVSPNDVLTALLTDTVAVQQLLRELDVAELTVAGSEQDNASGQNLHTQAVLGNNVKRVLAYSMEEWVRARGMHLPPESPAGAFFRSNEFISPEFILLGLLREAACDAAKLLQSRGLTVEKARELLTEQSR